MGESQANAGCGLVIEGGVPSFQLWWAQTTPAGHGFVELTAAEFDAARLQVRCGVALSDALPPLQAAEVMTWGAAVYGALTTAMMVAPASGAWG